MGGSRGDSRQAGFETSELHSPVYKSKYRRQAGRHARLEFRRCSITSKAAGWAAEPRKDENWDLEIKVTIKVLVSGLATAIQKRMGGEGGKI